MNVRFLKIPSQNHGRLVQQDLNLFEAGRF